MESCFCLAVTKDETLWWEKNCFTQIYGSTVYGGNIDLLIEKWTSASERCLYELYIAALLILVYRTICHYYCMLSLYDNSSKQESKHKHGYTMYNTVA